MELHLLIKTLLKYKNQMMIINNVKVTPEGVFLIGENGNIVIVN